MATNVKTGVFQNSTTVLVELGLTNEELRIASTLPSNPLQIKDKEGNVTFELRASAKTAFGDDFVSFPIPKNKKPVKVIFTVDEEDDKLLKYRAAVLKKNLTAVEKQVVKELKVMNELADSIEEL